MTDAADEIVTFRLGPKDRSTIRRLIESGEFRNRSDFLRYAVKNALREFDVAAPRAPLDLELEDYKLPASDDATRKTGASGRRGRSEMTRS